MKKYVTIAGFGIVLAVVLGFISLNGISATTLFVNPSATNTEHATMLGHVTYIVKDSTGAVTQYLQTDNLVTDKGRNCSAQALFNASATTQCVVPARTSTTNGFNWIAVSNSTATVANGDTAIVLTGSGATTTTRQGSMVFTTASNAGSQAVVTMSKTFSFTAGNATTVRISGLFDAASSGNLFADQNLSPTVTVSNGDTLTVKWTINVG